MSIQVSPPSRSVSYSSPSSSQSQLQGQGQGQTQNPISLRLYKVLNTTFEDADTKEALRTLSELYAPPASQAKGKEVKLTEQEQDRVSLGDLEESNGAVGEVGVGENVPGELAARARRSLRRDVENKLAESSRSFLRAFGEVDKVRRHESSLFFFSLSSMRRGCC